MSFYLGVWNSSTAISVDEAARHYRLLADTKSAAHGFDGQVYAFYSRLTNLYPEIEMVPESELDDCPWSCAIDVSDRHVILAIEAEHSEKVLPLVLGLAEQHGLVCFDPQAGQVHLPPFLRAQRAGARD